MVAFPICSYCGSIDVQAGLDTFQCLRCGASTRYTGTPVPPEPQFEAGGGGELQLAHLSGHGEEGE